MPSEEINYPAIYSSVFLPDRDEEAFKREILARRMKLREEDHALFVKAQQYHKNLKSGKYISPRRRKMLEQMKKDKEEETDFVPSV